MKIVVGSDHAGFTLTQEVVDHVTPRPLGPRPWRLQQRAVGLRRVYFLPPGFGVGVGVLAHIRYLPEE